MKKLILTIITTIITTIATTKISNLYCMKTKEIRKYTIEFMKNSKNQINPDFIKIVVPQILQKIETPSKDEIIKKALSAIKEDSKIILSYDDTLATEDLDNPSTKSSLVNEILIKRIVIRLMNKSEKIALFRIYYSTKNNRTVRNIAIKPKIEADLPEELKQNIELIKNKMLVSKALLN